MDSLYKSLCEDVPEGQKANWAKFKEEAADALCKDLAEHLSCEWPPNTEGVKNNALREFYVALGTAGTIRHAHAQYKWDATTSSQQRLPNTFLLRLNFGVEALLCQSALRIIEKETRRASGLKVDGTDTFTGAGERPKRRLVYLERTASEREEKGRKGKGKGKNQAPEAAQGGAEPVKGKGKAKGKKGDKGKAKSKKGKKGAPNGGQ